MVLRGHKPLRDGGVDLLAIVVVGEIVLSPDQWRDDSNPGVKGPASNYVGLRIQPNKRGPKRQASDASPSLRNISWNNVFFVVDYKVQDIVLKPSG